MFPRTSHGAATTARFFSHAIATRDPPQDGFAVARLAVVDWDYNAWGIKYPPFDLDEVVPTRLAEILKLPVFYPT